jgi:hypothetical protein
VQSAQHGAGFHLQIWDATYLNRDTGFGPNADGISANCIFGTSVAEINADEGIVGLNKL